MQSQHDRQLQELSGPRVRRDPVLRADLQELLRSSIDSRHRLGEAASLVETDSIRVLLSSAADRRWKHERSLGRILQEYDVEVPEHGTFAGMMHRNWLAFRALLNFGHPVVVLIEARRGERRMSELCDQALERVEDPGIEALLKSHKQHISETRWKIESLLQLDSLLN